MKYKVGDRVRVKANKNTGKIVSINENENTVIVAFDGGMSGHSCIYDEEYLESIEEQHKNLIPQVAKLLGVEIGEEFYLRENFENDTNMNTYKFVEDGLKLNTNYGWEYVTLLDELLAGEYIIKKLPPKPRKLTEAERVILENLPKECRYITRDNEDGNNDLVVHINKPEKT